MSKTRMTPVKTRKAIEFMYKWPSVVTAYGGKRGQTIALDDEYRKIEALPLGATVFVSYMAGDSRASGNMLLCGVSGGHSGGAVVLKNTATGLHPYGTHIVYVSGHGEKIATRDAHKVFRSKLGAAPKNLTRAVVFFDEFDTYLDTYDAPLVFPEKLKSLLAEEYYGKPVFVVAYSGEPMFMEAYSREPIFMEPRFGKRLIVEPITVKPITVKPITVEPKIVEPKLLSAIKDEPKADWVHEPEGILQRLENKSVHAEDCEASILFAEVKPFRGEQKARLLKALGAYIDQHRFVEDQNSLITLCSAIRKFAMNMPESQFEHYANWLLPTATATLHHEAEMEFAKGICWRLEFEAHSWPATYPHLTQTLFDLVDSYLSPRLILQKSYANTAMYGIVALHVLEAASVSEGAVVAKLHKKLADSGVKWFAEMVSDNVDEAIQYISERDDVLAQKITKIRQG